MNHAAFKLMSAETWEWTLSVIDVQCRINENLLPVVEVQVRTFVFVFPEWELMGMNGMKIIKMNIEMRKCNYWGKLFLLAYPSVEPMMSSACDEIISAIISSFIASFSLRHLRPPGSVMGRSCGCKPRKPRAFFCFWARSSVTFCFNSADRSVFASLGSCYISKCVFRMRNGRAEGGGKIKYMQHYNLRMKMIRKQEENARRKFERKG